MKPQQPIELHKDKPIARMKEYHRPQLIRYGDLRGFTGKNDGGPKSDSGSNAMADSKGQ